MAGPVVFEKIDKVLPLSSGQFEVIFGAIYELYLDKKKAPDLAADLRPMLGHYREYCWPDKYKKLECCGYCGAGVSEYPVSQRVELLRAAQHFLRDFESGRIEPRLYWDHQQPEIFLSALREFVRLMREEMTANPTTEDFVDRLGKGPSRLIDMRHAVLAARAIVEDHPGESVQSLTFDMVRRMLARGFRAGPRFKPDGTLDPWPDQSPGSVIRRIEAKWNELGHDPVSEDIAWFERPEVR
jgi:hypothetical protein